MIKTSKLSSFLWCITQSGTLMGMANTCMWGQFLMDFHFATFETTPKWPWQVFDLFSISSSNYWVQMSFYNVLHVLCTWNWMIKVVEMCYANKLALPIHILYTKNTWSTIYNISDNSHLMQKWALAVPSLNNKKLVWQFCMSHIICWAEKGKYTFGVCT